MRSRPSPTRCPVCLAFAECIDWNEVDVGVGRMEFEHEYECSEGHGVFALVDGAEAGKYEVVWRDGDPTKLICENEMSASGKCMATAALPDGGRVFCALNYRHEGAHENRGRVGIDRWSRYEREVLAEEVAEAERIGDRAFDELLGKGS